MKTIPHVSYQGLSEYEYNYYSSQLKGFKTIENIANIISFHGRGNPRDAIIIEPDENGKLPSKEEAEKIKDFADILIRIYSHADYLFTDDSLFTRAIILYDFLNAATEVAVPQMTTEIVQALLDILSPSDGSLPDIEKAKHQERRKELLEKAMEGEDMGGESKEGNGSLNGNDPSDEDSKNDSENTKSSFEGKVGDGGRKIVGGFSVDDIDSVGKNLNEASETLLNADNKGFSEITMKDTLGHISSVDDYSNINLSVLELVELVNEKYAVQARKDNHKFVDRKMRDFSEVTSLKTISDLMMPAGDIKFIKRQLNVRIRQPLPQQNLVLLIDDSGSMSSSFKMAWVKAMLIQRTEQSLKENTKLFVATFLDTFYGLKEIKSYEEAYDYFHKVCSFGGGGTDIQKSLIDLKTEMEDLFTTIDTDIMLINDGEDYIDKKTWDFNAKFHSIQLISYNKDLAQAAEASGGNVIHVTPEKSELRNKIEDVYSYNYRTLVAKGYDD